MIRNESTFLRISYTNPASLLFTNTRKICAFLQDVAQKCYYKNDNNDDNKVGQVRLEEVRLDQVRLFYITLGQARLGQIRLGYARLGYARLGQARLGQARLGQARLGQLRFSIGKGAIQIILDTLVGMGVNQSITKYHMGNAWVGKYVT